MADARRIRRLKRRIATLERRLDALDDVDKMELRVPLNQWIEKVLARTDLDLDRNDDGVIDFEEIVDVAVEYADEAIDRGPVWELVSDYGLEIMGELAVLVYKRDEQRLSRRLTRLRQRVAKLESGA